ncbi:lipopolysaccharide biosynthesis protein [uncultured Algimonas sp.]|uniref:lipopolysaccharide biosynthesis protein n=1 Tax=uncultured Algimonas sp. TaxID=1547920 RepID=UPI0026047D76|nr:lipopolysaccharide biosynthesis protein [uncultured Algimonas sp.]
MGRTLLAYLPVNLANVVVSFGLIVLLTRLLSPEEFGRYAVAMITLQFVHMAAFTWLEASMARFQARAERQGDLASHLRTLYVMAAVSGCGMVMAFLALLFALPLATPMKTALGFAIGSAGLQVVFNIGMEAHRASHRVARYSLTYSVQTLLSFSAGIALVLFTPLREAGPFLGIAIGLCLGLAVDLPFMLKRQAGGRFQADKAKRYAAYGFPICFSLVLGYALNTSDVYIIAAMMGDAPAGQYNAGYNLANRPLDMLFIWISMAMTPAAVTAYEKGGFDKSQPIMRSYGSTLLWVTMPAAIGIALVAEDAGFILGEGVRAEAVTVMPLIAIAGLINGVVTYYVQRAFMLSGKTREIIWVMVPPLVLNIGLNILLIPDFGLMGAVAATLAGYAAALILSVAVSRRHYPLPLPVREALEVLLACGIMTVAILTLPSDNLEPGAFSLIVKALVGAFTYITVCLMIDAAGCQRLIGQAGRCYRRRNLAEPAK